MNILVVDDEKEITDLIQIYLENYSLTKKNQVDYCLDCVYNKPIRSVLCPYLGGAPVFLTYREQELPTFI